MAIDPEVAQLIEEIREDYRNQIWKARTENMVLQSICASLLCQIAALYPDRRSKLGTMTAGMMGLMDGVAKDAPDYDTRAATACVERICAMAEKALVVQPEQQK